MGLDNVKKCRGCRRIFQYPGYGPELCPACRQEDEEMFTKVKTYLRDNPGRTLTQTSEDCEVPKERIRAWLKEERLEFSGSGETGLTCEKCGKQISSGTICDECRQAMSRAAGEIMRSMDKPVAERPKVTHTGDKMRFLGRK